MYIDFSSLFHQSSKDLSDKGTVKIPQDDSLWPKEWSTIYYKSYPRVQKIALDRVKPEADYFDVLERRHSHRVFDRRIVKKETLSQLLLFSFGILEKESMRFPSRAHPSGGGRFPIEIYPIIFLGNKEIPAGLYHYNVKEHALDVLWQRPFNTADVADLFVYEWIQNASLAIVMTGVFWRTKMKYGERGYRYVLLEAGHIGENVYLTAEALGLRCCAMGGMRDENIEKFLDIDGITESVIHSLILG